MIKQHYTEEEIRELVEAGRNNKNLVISADRYAMTELGWLATVREDAQGLQIINPKAVQVRRYITIYSKEHNIVNVRDIAFYDGEAISTWRKGDIEEAGYEPIMERELEDHFEISEVVIREEWY